MCGGASEVGGDGWWWTVVRGWAGEDKLNRERPSIGCRGGKREGGKERE